MKNLSFWINELFPVYRYGKPAGSGPYSPGWMISLYFPHSFMLSGMLLGNIFFAMLGIIIVGVGVFFHGSNMSLALLCVCFLLCVSMAVSFDRAAKLGINIVDYQILSLMPSYKSQIDFVNKLLLFFVRYIILFSGCVFVVFLLLLGELPKFSSLQWAIGILAPLSVGSLSCLVISNPKRVEKLILFLSQFTSYIVLAVIVSLYFDPFIDFLWVTAYLTVQISVNLYQGRKSLVERDWG